MLRSGIRFYAAPLALSAAFVIVPAHAQITRADGPLPTFEVSTVRCWNPPPPPPSAGGPEQVITQMVMKGPPSNKPAAASDRVHLTVPASLLIAIAFNIPMGQESRK